MIRADMETGCHNATGKPAVFLDRDGIVNVSPGPGYVERWEDFQLMPEFPDVLRTIQQLGFVAVVVTNQRGVALGRMAIETVESIHRNLRAVLTRDFGLHLLDILYCPHHADACTCRKPQPGMLLEAARRHNLDLAASWMIGDSERDIEAGQRAGCHTVLVSAGNEPSRADVRVASMADLRRRLPGILAPTG